ncbi:MAG: alpha/beta hydrolase [Eubacteriales bacterium]
MTKKQKRLALATGIGVSLVGLSVTAFFGVTDYFINYAIMRPEPSDEDDPLAPSYEKSEEEQANKDAGKAKVAQWKTEVQGHPLTMSSYDGLQLWGMTYPQEKDSDLWLIAVHGYQSEHSSVEDFAVECYERGYNVLLPDLRGHGNSEGDYIGMGLHDSIDILSWIDVIIEGNPNAKILLFGQSMGAATVMITAGQEGLPENVQAVIEDCGYTDSYQMMVEQLDYRYGLPEFPLMPMTNFMAEFRTDYDMRDASPMEFLQNATVPILFIHGDQDTFVLPYMIDELYQSYEGEKEYLMVEGADHVASRNVAPTLYFDTVFSFLEKHMPDTNSN